MRYLRTLATELGPFRSLASAYAPPLRGELSLEFFSLTSTFGWAALLRWWEEKGGRGDLQERLLVGT